MTFTNENLFMKIDQKRTSLDDAMALTGIGLFNIASLALCGCILLGMIMETVNLGYVIPASQCDLSLTLGQKGWLSAIPFIGIIITSHMWGWLADTKGRKPVMLTSMTVGSILSILSAFSPNLWWFAGFRFAASLFISGPSAIVYAFLGELNSLRHRDKMVAFGASFIGIGTLLLSFVAWGILPLAFSVPIQFIGIEFKPWRLLIIICALPYVVGSLALAFFPESPKFLVSRGRIEEALEVTRIMFAWNKRKDKNDFPVLGLEYERVVEYEYDQKSFSVLRSMRNQTAPLFKPPLLSYTMIACFVQFGNFAVANGFYVWFPMILNRMSNYAAYNENNSITICEIMQEDLNRNTTNFREMTVQKICDDSINANTYIQAIYMGMIFCSVYLVAGFIIDYVGKKLLIICIITGSGLSGIAIHWITNQTIAVVLFGVLQFCGTCIGLMNAVVVSLYPTHLRGMAVCLSLMVGRLGSVTGSNVIGHLIERNCSVSFFVFGGLLLACAAMCFALPNMQKPKKNTNAI